MSSTPSEGIPAVSLRPLDRAGVAWAQAQVTAYHYLHAPVDARCSVEGYGIYVDSFSEPVGCLLVGRPEATRCRDWYGSLADVAAGWAPCSRWEVLNLARVWLHPSVQGGGAYCRPDRVPGFTDRRGVWHSTLASTALRLLVQRVGFDYLERRPPCFLNEPYQLCWLLSYCDPTRHRGTIYRAAEWELYRTNARGLQTWRIALPPLTPAQDARVRTLATYSLRSIHYRTARERQEIAQPLLF